MKNQSTSSSFEEKYPALSIWVRDGWIEIGQSEWGESFVRVLDEGGQVWEGKKNYKTIDVALADADRAIAAWLEENG